MQTPVRLSFEEYLSLPPGALGEQRYLWINGELHPMSPESRRNRALAMRLALLIINQGISDERLDVGGCQIICPPVPGETRNRYPDLVLLLPEHLDIGTESNIITEDMNPPQIVVEVLSPGVKNQKRDLEAKRYQYSRRGIPEYWIINPEVRSLSRLVLVGKTYSRESIHTKKIETPFLPKTLDLAALWAVIR